MYNESISHKRLWAWLAVAISAPLAHYSGGSWLALLILGVICWGVAALLPDDFDLIWKSRVLCILQLVWFVLLLSQLMPMSAAYWPGEKSEIVVPAVLLALGAYSCNKRASRVAGVLFWVSLIMFVPIAVAGAKDVQLRWLIPQSMEASAWILPVLLLPCGAKLLAEDGEGQGWYPMIVLFGVGLWALTAGVLSPIVAAQEQNPFREVSRSLAIGAASRFESLISVTVTTGWFCLGSLLIRCASVCCEALGIQGKIAPWLVAAAGMLLQLSGLKISGETGAALTAFLWIFLPLLYGKILSKKREKRA